jgi:CheY-like chemotaxis protein
MKDNTSVVLLVEDNLAHAEIIVRLLRNHRIACRVCHVPDGEAALDYLFRRGAYTDPQQYPTPNLVLLDLRLPKIDGLEVLERIKTSGELSVLPVVVLSSSDTEADIAAAYRRQVNSYLVKPIDYKKFEGLIKSMGTYWLTLNRQPLPG